MGLNVRNLSQIRAGTASPAMMNEAFQDLIAAHDQLAQAVNASTTGTSPAPTPINHLQVTAADGIFHASITDNGLIYRGINYHLQYSTKPNFESPITVHLGPARDYRAHLGNQNLYWRAFSDYPTSPVSQPVYHGGANPIMVSGGGSLAGPTIPPGMGSGTGMPGQISGFGPLAYRTLTGTPPSRS